MNLLKKLSVNFLATGGVSLLIAIVLNTYFEKTYYSDMPKFFKDFLLTIIGNSYSGNFLYDVILLVLIIIGVVFVLTSAVLYCSTEDFKTEKMTLHNITIIRM